MNPYEDLGVERNATEAEIASAYRRRAKKAHPDAGGKREDFERLNRSKLVLLDPARRAKFDSTGTIDDGADTTAAQAMNVVTSAVQSAFAEAQQRGHNLATFNLLAKARGSVAQQHGALTAQSAENTRVIKSLGKVAARFKAKAKKVNRIAPLLEGQIAAIKQANAANAQNLEIMKRALEILDDHEYEVEPEQSVHVGPGHPLWFTGVR